MPLLKESTSVYRGLTSMDVICANGYDSNILWMGSFYIMFFWTDEQVCSVSKRVITGHRTVLILSTSVHIKPGSASACGLKSCAPVCYLTCWLLNDRMLVKGVPLPVRQSLWFQHDEAPAQHGEHVWQWLNGRWIEHWGWIARAPWSPDLTLMDFILCT